MSRQWLNRHISPHHRNMHATRFNPDVAKPCRASCTNPVMCHSGLRACGAQPQPRLLCSARRAHQARLTCKVWRCWTAPGCTSLVSLSARYGARPATALVGRQLGCQRCCLWCCCWMCLLQWLQVKPFRKLQHPCVCACAYHICAAQKQQPCNLHMPLSLSSSAASTPCFVVYAAMPHTRYSCCAALQPADSFGGGDVVHVAHSAYIHLLRVAAIGRSEGERMPQETVKVGRCTTQAAACS